MIDLTHYLDIDTSLFSNNSCKLSKGKMNEPSVQVEAVEPY